MSKKLVISREFSSEEIDEIIKGLFNFRKTNLSIRY